MTTKKNSTPTYDEVLAAAEQVTRKHYADASDRLTELRRYVERCASDVETAEETVAAIEGTHRRSYDADKVATASEYAAALSEVSLATMRRDGASREAARVAKQANSTDTEVAEAIAPAIERALPTVRVVTTMLPLSHLPLPSLSELPLAVVAQTSPTTGGDGTLSAGTVEVSLFRFDGVHEKLDGRVLEDAAHDLGHWVEHIHRKDDNLGAGVMRDTVAVRVHRVHVGLPAIEEVNPFLLGVEYASRLALAARTPGWTVKRSLETNEYKSSHVTTRPSRSAKITQQAIDGDGTRTVTVEAVVTVDVIERVGINLEVLVNSVARELAGITVQGVGQVESVDCRASWGPRGESVRVDLTAVAKSTAAMARAA